MKRLVSLILIIIVSAASALSCAAFSGTVDYEKAREAVSDILAYELRKNGADSVQGWIDGELTDNAGKSSEWYALILSRSGEYDFTRYTAALSAYIAENEITSPTTRMKNALALLSTGGDRKAADEIAENSVGEQGIMSLIYGLHLLNNGCKCSRFTKDTLTAELLSMQFEDGGWAIMGTNGDIDVTAMTVQALAPQYGENDSVKDSIDRALSFLSEKQQDDGGYVSFGTANPESAAQVLIALSSLGIGTDDTRFVKNGNSLIDGILKYRLGDGSYSHTEGGDTNDTATVQAYLSLTAYLLSQDKHEMMYIFPVRDDISGEAAATEPVPVVTTAAVTTEAIPAYTTVPTPQPSGQPGYKPVVYCVIGGLTMIACAVLFVTGKRRMSNFVAVFIVAGAAVLFTVFTDFRSSEDYYSGNLVHKDNAVGTVTMTIRCDTVAGKGGYVPDNGIILDTTEFEIADGNTVYDILTEAARAYNIQLQANGDYIAGIAYIYEYDFGDLSGWIYHVNGDTPFVMCSDYKLSDGDVIEWLYTCELGNDL